MFLLLLILFVTVPLVELALLIRIAQAIDLLPTIILVVVTGIVGAALARREGLKTWTRVQADLADGRMPTAEIIDAFLILVAGVLLVTPGIITDLVGFSLLVPPIRNFYKRKVAGHFRSRIVMLHHPPGDEFVDVEPTEAHDDQHEQGPRSKV
ncbi:MAG: FxsA family protein [Planctomycetes bacterium]|nr:FxsA family protein [Planctomycetota bacterium]